MKCERCEKNPARVRIDQIVNGRREQHYLCQSCVDELMGAAMGQMGDFDGEGTPDGAPFGFVSKNGNAASAAGGVNTATAERRSNNSKTPTLDQYGRDLTREVEEGRLDPAAGRQRETRRLITVLGRRQKNNPVLIGEPGVGKTAIVENLARRIYEGDVPSVLRGKRIVSLNIGGMVAGAMFRGQFEQRIKSILEELRQAKDVIVFIDELHTVVGAGAAEGAVGAADMLKPALARGELRCIGATTLDEYRKHIEKDAALERRFQPVMVREPSVEDTISILRGLKQRYEQHHNIKIKDAALVAAAVLSHRYIADRFLPDKAIDLVDEAAARIRIQMESKPQELDDVERRIMQLEIDRVSLARDKDDSAARERLSRVDAELAQLKEQADALRVRWQAEKSGMDRLTKVKAEIEAA